MADSKSDTTRFRSATQFPTDIAGLEREQGNALYTEMRDCLIFTNRSRAQLIRRNTEHKATTLQLRERIQHFQTLIDQLQTQKQIQLQAKEALITQLAAEMTEMGEQLDTLADAFDAVGDPELIAQTHWGYGSLPGRFMRFLKAVRSLMQWWKRKDDESHAGAQAALPSADEDDQDRRDRPQLYTDQASVNRSLLDR